jgi:hypothetical protein
LSGDDHQNVLGIPTAAGTYQFTLRANNAGPPAQTTTRQFTITVIDYPEIPTQSLPTGIINAPYQATLNAIGGTRPYTWTVDLTVNPLPQGLQLDPSTGVISGIPTERTDTSRPFDGRVNFILRDSHARRLTPSSPLDSVLRILDANGSQPVICDSPPYYPNSFFFPCLSDDMNDGQSTDSRLGLRVPENVTGPVTFYLHVLDYRGDARPDFVYTITVTGAD